MKQRRRIWWWLVSFLGLLVLALAYQHLAPRWALSAYKARLRVQGVPLTLEECAPALVTEQVAAANRFAAAAQSLPNWGPTLPSRLPSSMQITGPGRANAGWRQPHVGYVAIGMNAQTRRLMVKRYGLKASESPVTESSPPEEARGPVPWDDLKSALETQASLLQEITEASRVDAFNWNLDYSQGFSTLLTQLAPCKRAIEPLRAATQVAVREGRFEDATSWMETQLRLVRNMEQEGLLINELVRIAMAAMAWDGTWEVLLAEGFTDAQLARLQRAWEDIHAVEGMIRALQQERALALIEYQRCYIEVIQATMDAAERRLVLVAEHPVPATALAPGEPWQPPITSRSETVLKRHLFAGTVLPPLELAMGKAFRVQMQREMALAAIALKRYRMRRGEVPETLDALIPEFLSTAPVDWMDGRPLRYPRLDAGPFLLYSVNADQTDNGGDPTGAKPGTGSHSPYHARDFVWPEEVLPQLVNAEDLHSGFRLSSTDGDPQSLRLAVRTNEPPQWITVVPRTSYQEMDLSGQTIIGMLEVSTGSPPNLIQTLKVWGADASRLKSMFEVLDINFDGYPDLLTPYEAGAKSGRRSLWLYESSHGVYVTNAATARFRELSHNTLELDHDQQLIRMTRFIGICTNSWETWRIRDDQLMAVEAMIHRPEDDEYCQVTHMQSAEGEMQVVAEERTACLKPD